MSALFEELDYQATELGELILRRRRPLANPDDWIYEVKLDGRFLMSSLVSTSERELARRALQRLDGTSLHVLVGGLGLGCTAAEALADPRLQRLDVVERLQPVIDWHQRRLVPLAATLCDDARCHLLHDDCLTRLGQPPTEQYDALLLDIDDSPQDLLDAGHGSFYDHEHLRRVRRWLRPGGIFALWTNVAAAPALTAHLAKAFGAATVDEIEFDNPLLDAPEVNALYFAG